MEDLGFIPTSLNYEDVAPGNIAELSPCVRFLYDKIHIVIEQEANADQDIPEIFKIQFRYFNLTAAQVNQSLEHFNIIQELRPAVTEEAMYGIYKLMKRTLNPGFPLTRQHRDQLTALLTDNNKNQHLKLKAAELIHEGGRPAVPAMSSYEAFEECFQDFAELLGALLQKAMYGAQLYTTVYDWLEDTTRLRTKVGEMLVSLTERGEANDLAQQIVAKRRTSQLDYERFINRRYSQNPMLRYNTHFGHNTDQLEANQFEYEGFVRKIRDQGLILQTFFRTPTQRLVLLDDPFLKEKSAEVDNLIEKIRGYSPSAEALLDVKRRRLLKRISELKGDFDKFKASPDKSLAKAKVVLETLKFLSKSCEEINLEGVDFTENSIGIGPEQITEMVEYTASFIDKEENSRKKTELQMKLTSSEYTKSLPTTKLPRLTSPADFLHWSQVVKSMFQVIQNEMSRIVLIRASLGNALDRSFLESCYSSADMIAYLKKKYSDKSYIISMEISKLYALKDCGDSLQKMISNSEVFLLSYSLLKSHNLVSKVDRSVRDRLFEKLFTNQQRTMFSIESVRAESYWNQYDRNKLPLSDNLNLPEDEVSPKQSTPYQTPDSSLVQKASQDDDSDVIVEPRVSGESADIDTTEDEEERMENRRRNFFIRMHLRYYEAARRVHFSEMVMENKSARYKNFHSSGGEKSKRNHFNYQVRTGPPCPAGCGKNHSNNLYKCEVFRRMTIPERKRLIADMTQPVCRRCLLYSFLKSEHQISDGKCPVQEKANVHCKHPLCKEKAYSHSPLLCDNQERESRGQGQSGQPGPPAQRGRGHFRGRGGRGGRRGGGGGGRGRGQFRRQTRKGRISASEKAYRVTAQEGDDKKAHSNHDCWDDDCTLHKNVNFIQSAGASYKVEKNKVCEPREIDVSCASSCILVSPHLNLSGLCLFDSGSSLSFVRLSVARKLGLEPVSEWNGFLSTLTMKNQQRFSIFIVKIRGEKDEIFTVPCLGCEDIGVREQLDSEALNRLCKIAGICKSKLDQGGGQLSILLGTNAFRAFPKSCKAPNQAKLSKKHPNIKLFYSRLSQEFFFAGQYGSHWAKQLKDENVAHNFMISAKGVFRSSFRKFSDLSDRRQGYIHTVETDDEEVDSITCAQGDGQGDGQDDGQVGAATSCAQGNARIAANCAQLQARSEIHSGHYQTPTHVTNEEDERPNMLHFKGNQYKVIGFTLDGSNCFLKLKCEPHNCSIHQSIQEFQEDFQLPQAAPRLLPPYNTGYVNMIRGRRQL